VVGVMQGEPVLIGDVDHRAHVPSHLPSSRCRAVRRSRTDRNGGESVVGIPTAIANEPQPSAASD
jgi:hypothetical protein